MKVVAEIGQNEMVSYTAVVLNSSFPLKVTIVWYDYPQTEGFTGTALINDIDLQVSSLTEDIRSSKNIRQATSDFALGTSGTWAAQQII